MSARREHRSTQNLAARGASYRRRAGLLGRGRWRASPGNDGGRAAPTAGRHV